MPKWKRRGPLSGRFTPRTGAVNASVSGTRAAGFFQLVAERCPSPVKSHPGVPGRDAYFIRDGGYVGPSEVDTADQVRILRLEQRNEIIDALADSALQIGIETWINFWRFARLSL